MEKKAYRKPAIAVQQTEPVMAIYTASQSRQLHVENRGKLYDAIITWADNEYSEIEDPD